MKYNHQIISTTLMFWCKIKLSIFIVWYAQPHLFLPPCPPKKVKGVTHLAFHRVLHCLNWFCFISDFLFLGTLNCNFQEPASIMGRQADFNSICFICVVLHQHAKTSPHHVGKFIKTFKLKKKTSLLFVTPILKFSLLCAIEFFLSYPYASFIRFLFWYNPPNIPECTVSW